MTSGLGVFKLRVDDVLSSNCIIAADGSDGVGDGGGVIDGTGLCMVGIITIDGSFVAKGDGVGVGVGGGVLGMMFFLWGWLCP
ncbi:Hypothetical predicted protein [Octopus vulgaris]|uniref:Uncharacterized protein n=1 Tax=Octopus vulgaris TaxID=6645 RepID=A0AA36BKA1_OCTVU|nr:Hypothetical predicted protein [Octopus vulgaris]